MHSIERLKQALRFDENLGRFFWLERRWHTPVGKMAGSFDAHGYGQINFDGRLYKEHRLAWAFVHGAWPEGQIDHINHDRRDNRPSNLRVTNNMENHRNRPMQNTNKTGCPGVWYDAPNDRYRVYIGIKGRRINIGSFSNKSDAIKARLDANREHGFHENHGVGYGQPKPAKVEKAASGVSL